MANELVPFGKYKGQPIEVLQADSSYVEWLKNQDWVQQRYPELRTIIINNCAVDSDSPEHNLMQSKFLDDLYCLRLFRTVQSKSRYHVDKWRESVVEKTIDAMQVISQKRKLGVDRYSRCDPKIDRLELMPDSDRVLAGEFAFSYKNTWDDERHIKQIRALIGWSNPTINTGFEQSGWDVVTVLETRIWSQMKERVEPFGSDWPGISDQHSPQFPFEMFCAELYLELKPTLGDNYPSVLRQIKSYKYTNSHAVIRSRVLLIDEFQSVVPFDSVRKLFWRERIHLLKSSDLCEQSDLPSITADELASILSVREVP